MNRALTRILAMLLSLVLTSEALNARVWQDNQSASAHKNEIFSHQALSTPVIGTLHVIAESIHSFSTLYPLFSQTKWGRDFQDSRIGAALIHAWRNQWGGWILYSPGHDNVIRPVDVDGRWKLYIVSDPLFSLLTLGNPTTRGMAVFDTPTSMQHDDLQMKLAVKLARQRGLHGARKLEQLLDEGPCIFVRPSFFEVSYSGKETDPSAIAGIMDRYLLNELWTMRLQLEFGLMENATHKSPSEHVLAAIVRSSGYVRRRLLEVHFPGDSVRDMNTFFESLRPNHQDVWDAIQKANGMALAVDGHDDYYALVKDEVPYHSEKMILGWIRAAGDELFDDKKREAAREYLELCAIPASARSVVVAERQVALLKIIQDSSTFSDIVMRMRSDDGRIVAPLAASMAVGMLIAHSFGADILRHAPLLAMAAASLFSYTPQPWLFQTAA